LSAPTPGREPRGSGTSARRRPGEPPVTLRGIAQAHPPDAPVTVLAGVSEAQRKKLERVGVLTIADLLHYYPYRHADYSETVGVVFLAEGTLQSVRARVERVTVRRSMRGGKAVVEAFLSDDSGRMKAMWFNQPYVATSLQEGEEYVLSGKVQRDRRGAGLVMMSPRFEAGDKAGLHTGRRVPLYSETGGLQAGWMRRWMSEALPTADLMTDEVPDEVAQRQDLPSLAQALRQIHFPATDWEAVAARRRIAFRQLLLIQLGVLLSREQRAQQEAPEIPYDVETARAIRDALPFPLTDAQRKAAHVVFTDMAAPHPMARLLQGDVGSGKTAVAAMASAMVARSGHQVLFMAPTEILAQQHARTLAPYLEPLKMRMELLVGSTAAANRRRILAALEAGELDVLVGTHALLEEGVVPSRLGLVINDEQHRFGVAQRAVLAAKGTHPHVLSMTATPIPRTLQLTAYGDLTVSVLDEMPPGRVPVETRLVLPPERDDAYVFVRRQVGEGRQVFVICPLVEASDRLQVRSATGEFERLRADVFPDLRLALLHGRMKAAEKDATMEAFKAGSFDILVSTAVVEVGVDVPNATVMMIEGAERFGLAQLHQFRGRVGRGGHAAHCLLLSDSDSPEANLRLRAVVDHASGFDLAEVDLELRGPGDVLGATGAQHGHGDGLMVAGLLDARLIAAAREEAEGLIAGGLDRHPGLREAVSEFNMSGAIS
jgi:ATP-dependent DNA helicase RecG